MTTVQLRAPANPTCYPGRTDTAPPAIHTAAATPHRSPGNEPSWEGRDRSSFGKCGIRNATPTMKLVLAVLAAFIVFAAVEGFAASLGSSSGGFGANSKVISSCGTGLSFVYTTAFSTAISGYAVKGIDLSDIPAGCLGKSLSVTFYNSSTNASGSPVRATLPASGTTQSISIDPNTNTIDATKISGVAVVVS